MKSSNVFYAILILIAAAFAIQHFIALTPNEQSTEFTAKLVHTKSLFENYNWQTGTEFMRLVYEYPRDQVPSEATWFYVNVTIPDQIADRLDQLAQQYYKWKDSFYPRVYVAKDTGTGFDYKPIYYLKPIEYTPHGIPKKFQVQLKSSDIPSDYNYLVVSFHVPFFEDWDDNSYFCWDSAGDVDPEGQWEAVRADTKICVQFLYGKNWYTPYKSIGNTQTEFKWVVLKREIDLPVDPYKPLYMKYSLPALRYFSVSNQEAVTVIALDLVLRDNTTYTVLFRAEHNEHFPNPRIDYRNAMSNYDCAFVLDSPGKILDLASIIPTHCSINWTNVKAIKNIYIGFNKNAPGQVYGAYVWIGYQNFQFNP